MKKSRNKKSSAKVKKYSNAPGKGRFAYFLASFILSISFVLFLGGVLIVDKNTRMVGWDENRTELALASTAKSFKLTVAGDSFSIDKRPFLAAGDFAAKLETGYDYVKPATDRVRDMICMAARSGLAGMIKKLRIP